MNTNYIASALCYHGQPLQKIWEDERGVDDLRHLNLTQPNYSVYQERQKYFTFQERAKRLKIHQFLARKANELYDRQLVSHVMEDSWLAQVNNCFAPQPPYEYYMNIKDKRMAYAHRMSVLKQGDIICATVLKIITNANRIIVKPLCTAEPLHYYLADIPIKACIMQDQWGPLPLDKQGNPRAFAVNDLIRCEVSNVSADVERLTLGMVAIYNKTPNIQLGLCDINDFPSYYRKIHNKEPPPSVHYEEQLKEMLEFDNPNYDVLFQLNGLLPNEQLSMMSTLKAGFPDNEYATELRQKQASQWAFRSVADGIEHFKNGQQVEAFQCLNKALNIDPRNVEGLVARGALYANRGNFLKGLKDFETALMLNKYHVNARKYMGETLVALGRSYEEENRIPEAVKAYSDCLNLLPQHEQARSSLDALQQRPMPNAGAGFMCMQPQPQLSNELLHLPNASSSNAVSSDDSSSSSTGSDNDTQANSNKLQQPFYALEQDKRAISDALTANEFKLDDDETMSSVRKLLRDASKHKKAKKKSKKKKSKERKYSGGSSCSSSKKSKTKEDKTSLATEAALEMLKKIDYAEAYRLMNSSCSDAQLRSQLKNYFKQKQRSESPPPPPPPMLSTTSASNQQRKAATATVTSSHSSLMLGPSTSRYAAAAAKDDEQAPPPPKFRNYPEQQQQRHHQHQEYQQEQQKLSFQIKKRALQMDKFGLLRLASHSQSRSRSRSPKRRRSNSRSNSRRTTSRRRSHSRNRNSRSPSRSHNIRRSRSRRRYTRSRSCSPPPRYGSGFRRFNNGARNRYSRSPTRTRSRSRSYSPWRHQQQHQRFQPRGRGRGRFQRRWHDDNQRHHHNGRRRSFERDVSPPGVDGPSIEEVDSMIKEAQKERKQGIIESDKGLLKK
ncbi:CG6621 [Drosophila busckii]|uniref:CG6621 n=1 Tax=Drosophila busckii TaxID=30019 RepID=A0A0M4ENW0_DROBS|nr:tetratricopeptide repeat protein 14 homolog [Drosophila busckii]ALC45672.1 CG6621 [Drosophila busckii]